MSRHGDCSADTVLTRGPGHSMRQVQEVQEQVRAVADRRRTLQDVRYLQLRYGFLDYCLRGWGHIVCSGCVRAGAHLVPWSKAACTSGGVSRALAIPYALCFALRDRRVYLDPCSRYVQLFSPSYTDRRPR